MTDSLRPAQAWRPGDIIAGLYRVEDHGTPGGYGLVHRVHHLGWDLDLAVKTPSERALQAAGGRERFQQREAYEWVRLRLHPNIVQCFYVHTLDDGIPRLFMEYVAGGSLRTWLKRDRSQDLATALDVAIQLCRGLRWAHTHGLIHGDVTPANVLLTTDGTPKLTDFGLVKPIDQADRLMASDAQSDPPSPGSVTNRRGTPGYAAPEQRHQGEPTQASDVFSLAVVICDLLRGHLGFPQPLPGAASAAYRAMLRWSRPETSALTGEGYARLAEALRGCLYDDPKQRCADALALADELRAVYAVEAGQPYPRSAPDDIQLLADGMNNQAVSLCDLGRPDEALGLWAEALQVDPQHPESIYNRGLLHWRQGQLTDDALLTRLAALAAGPGGAGHANHLLALVHRERGDEASAGRLLQDAARQASESAAAPATLPGTHSARQGGWGPVRTLEGHSQSIYGVQLSADGEWAVSGGDDGTLRMWEVATGRGLQVFTAQGSIHSVSLSHDGHLALTGGGDGRVVLWDLIAGQRLQALPGHQGPVHAVCLSPDGRMALSGGEDGTVRLWDVAAGACLQVLTGHSKRVYAVALSADGQLALSSSRDATLRLWDLAGGHLIRTLDDPAAVRRAKRVSEPLQLVMGKTYALDEMALRDVVARAVCLSVDGTLALSGGYDDVLRLWEVETGRCLRIFKGHRNTVNAVCLSSDGRYALSGSDDATVRLWEVATGRCLRTFEGHTRAVHAVHLSADGRTALSAGLDAIIRVWTLEGSPPASPLQLSHLQTHAQLSRDDVQAQRQLEQSEAALQAGDLKTALALVRQTRALAGYAYHPRSLRAWRRMSRYTTRSGLRDAWPVNRFEGHTNSVRSVCLSRDGRYAFSASWDGALRQWDLATGDCVRVFEGHPSFVWSVSLSADGRFVLSGGTDEPPRLWDVASGHCLRTFEGKVFETRCVCLSPDGRFALGACRNLVLWDVSTGRWLRDFGDEAGWATAVHISADGHLALVGGGNDQIEGSTNLRLLDIASGRCVHQFKGHRGVVNAVCFSPDGRWALSGGVDQTIRMWETTSGECRQVLVGHTDMILSVQFSPDGQFAVSGSADHTLRLWDLRSGRSLRRLEGHGSAVHSAAFSADGRWLLSGSGDETIRLWELDWELAAPDPVSAEASIVPYLETFIIKHTPYAYTLPAERGVWEWEVRQSLTRRGQPEWTEADVQTLIEHLQQSGFGWVRAEAIRARLRRLADRRPKADRWSRIRERWSAFGRWLMSSDTLYHAAHNPVVSAVMNVLAVLLIVVIGLVLLPFIGLGLLIYGLYKTGQWLSQKAGH